MEPFVIQFQNSEQKREHRQSNMALQIEKKV